MLTHIKDRYMFRIERQIAKGGMGTIYEATQLGAKEFEKKVAIKTVLPALARNERFIEMFIAEGRLVADLVHENIVQIYQLGHCSKAGYYIVMEYVHGLSLHDFIHFHSATHERIPHELAVFITSRIARGLAYAHSRLDGEGTPLNIVHRDICPTNIMITTEGLPKLGDFGIAKAASSTVSANDRILMGKLFYMSPEQAQRIPVDHRSDVYSLGLVLFELLALTRARSKWSKDILDAARTGQVDWDALPDNVDPDLLTILRHMLTADPDLRYADTSQVAYELEYFIYREGYGPTVVTLENYLRQNFPFLYMRASVPRKTAIMESVGRTAPLTTSPME
ncbi:MAG: serine/threonine protein kinase [Lentisphaerae bacterium]|nr:serine/threonine protein kinase [Lentisphaerota bacterium]MBT4823415.1 serine/threonine protein kinase [Lentisphaerota bacterium]MBT5609744.1 serine/threonine protein kinase [Lentisphaerota bacterium]MBT7061386.1 serine/threonine protein kinase [Lentisphaerota bacterium]MBT7845076.1 serine/threonine protein kinase [Lentisphaerota bacterium]